MKRFLANIKKAKSPKYEPKPKALPLWDQVYWFAFFWSVSIAILLLKFGLNITIPSSWDQNLCIRDDLPPKTEPYMRAFVLDYHYEARYITTANGDFEFINTNRGIVADLCGYKELNHKLIHDMHSQQQLWEQVLYDKIVPDLIIGTKDVLAMPVDVVFLITATSSHCFGDLPLTKFINENLVLIVTRDKLSEPDMFKVMDFVRSEYVSSLLETEVLLDKTQTLTLWARTLRYLGLLGRSQKDCYLGSDLLRETVDPKHDFSDLVTPSFKLVLFGPIIAAVFVAFTSRISLLLRGARKFGRNKLISLADALGNRLRRANAD